MAKRTVSNSADHPPSDRPAPGIEAMMVIARRVTEISGCPVVGGIAVALHGWPRYTGDIDIYSSNFWETHTKLEAAGIVWNADRREHIFDGVAGHMVPDEALGGPPSGLAPSRVFASLASPTSSVASSSSASKRHVAPRTSPTSSSSSASLPSRKTSPPSSQPSSALPSRGSSMKSTSPAAPPLPPSSFSRCTGISNHD